METFSALLTLCAVNSPVPGEFPAQRPVTRSFHVSFDLRLNKRLSKQSWGWWFETLSRSLWHHRNGKHFHENEYPCLTVLMKWWLDWQPNSERWFFSLGVVYIVCSDDNCSKNIQCISSFVGGDVYKRVHCVLIWLPKWIPWDMQMIKLLFMSYFLKGLMDRWKDAQICGYA